ncbi:hypothetical protein [Botrimarina colliarenosi]|uniref:hypothetical protein n=1 Tax=Botrimarina colliarenosi TaxID=2528001 RepID=UPI0011B83E42|nr:hypothetical protein [Botrimarina colliarenosi]
MIVKGRGGLGNRLLGALTAISVAKAFRFPVHIDWTDQYYSDGTYNAFDMLFETHGFDRLEEMPAGSVYKEVWDGRLEWSGYELTEQLQVSWDSVVTDITEIALSRKIADSYVYGGYFFDRRSLASLGITPSARRVFHKHLAWSARVRELSDGLPQLDDAIGVHMRGTDLHSNVRVDKFVEAVNRIDSSCPVLVCTDDSALADQAVLAFGDRMVPLDRTYADGQPLHYRGSDDSKVQTTLECVRDLVALSKCKQVVGTQGSTFSSVAADIVSQQRRRLVLVTP